MGSQLYSSLIMDYKMHIELLLSTVPVIDINVIYNNFNMHLFMYILVLLGVARRQMTLRGS